MYCTAGLSFQYATLAFFVLKPPVDKVLIAWLTASRKVNIDKPGVIGKIGTILGDAKINIKEFLLSKKKSSELAFSVVRLDLIPSQQVIDQINSLDEVQSIQLLNC